MNLTKEKLLYFWRMRQAIFSKEENQEIKQRFEFVKRLFESMLDYHIRYDDPKVLCTRKANGHEDQEEVITLNGENPSLHYFGCKEDDVTASEAFKGVENMADAMPQDYTDMIKNIGCLLGGFDQNSRQMKDEFRIISNTVTEHNDMGSLISKGQSRHPSSHFADNNYFFNVIDTVHQIQDDHFNWETSKLTLRWPSRTYYNFPENELDEKAIDPQRETLRFRFPYKFFYMWTHKSSVLHLVGLKAYRSLVRQTDKLIQYPLDDKMNQDFNDFIGENGWKEYSKAIISFIPEKERSENFVEDLSLLLSIILSSEQDVKDYDELLESGNHALVLWGPPGTGKTYSAKCLVAKKLNLPLNELENELFSLHDKHPKGHWSIIQFHPNYAYEDFIGGISPRLEGNNLSYTLKTGIFKRMCDVAAKEENRKSKYFLIIDEINRADLSAVFGELMYALEYRDRSISLPNFDEPFVIPSNVYLIGTMNSIDKSLATFDIALRRRFAFYKVMPNLNALEIMLAESNISEDNLQQFIERCKKLNEDISSQKSRLQLGKDYQIGHAYFAKIKDFLFPKGENINEINSFSMEKLWNYHLEPLLEEYLGNRMEDSEISKCLNEKYEQFTASFE